MRIKIRFHDEEYRPFFFPKGTTIREFQKALIFQALKEYNSKFAENIYSNEKWKTSCGQPFKLFSYSRFPERSITIPEGVLMTSAKLTFYVSSPDTDFMGALLVGLSQGKTFDLNDRSIVIEKAEIEQRDTNCNSLTVRTDAPVLIKKITKDTEDRSEPFLLIDNQDDKEWAERLIVNNLRLKYSAFKKKDIAEDDFNLKVEILEWVSGRKTTYKDYFYLGNLLVLRMEGDSELINFAYDAGLGSHTGLGHGFLFAV